VHENDVREQLTGGHRGGQLYDEPCDKLSEANHGFVERLES